MAASLDIHLDIGHSPPQFQRLRLVGDRADFIRFEADVVWQGGARLNLHFLGAPLVLSNITLCGTAILQACPRSMPPYLGRCSVSFVVPPEIDFSLEIGSTLGAFDVMEVARPPPHSFCARTPPSLRMTTSLAAHLPHRLPRMPTSSVWRHLGRLLCTALRAHSTVPLLPFLCPFHAPELRWPGSRPSSTTHRCHTRADLGTCRPPASRQSRESRSISCRKPALHFSV